VLWKGKPKPGIWLEPADAFAIPFSIFWTLLVFGIFALAITGEATNVSPITYVILPVMLLFGIYFIIGRFIVAARMRANTDYILTSERAIFISGLFKKNERSVRLSSVAEIRLNETGDGRGTIEFGESNPFYKMMPRSWAGQSSVIAPAFEKIENPKKIYQMVIENQRAS